MAPFYTLEEDVYNSSHPLCDHCRRVGSFSSFDFYFLGSLNYHTKLFLLLDTIVLCTDKRSLWKRKFPNIFISNLKISCREFLWRLS
ncbi:hypothetical protein P8452_33613 [Trifolium repens]|nr:hypothetical protein P8452_33613 [Trifolium repens]